MTKPYIKGLVVGFIPFLIIASIVILTASPGCPPMCSSNPINSIIRATQEAYTGINRQTDSICLGESELSSTALKNKVTNLNGFVFKCIDANVCKQNNPIEVSPTIIKIKTYAEFRGVISCEAVGESLFDCEMVIVDA